MANREGGRMAETRLPGASGPDDGSGDDCRGARDGTMAAEDQAHMTSTSTERPRRTAANGSDLKSTQLSVPSPSNGPFSAPPIPTLPTIPSGNSDEDASVSSSDSAYASMAPNTAGDQELRGAPWSATPEEDYLRSVEAANGHKDTQGDAGATKPPSHEHVRRLSAAEIQQLATEPGSLPFAVMPEERGARTGPLPPRISLHEHIRSLRQTAFQNPELILSSPFSADEARISRTPRQWRSPAVGRPVSTPPGNRKRATAQGSSSPRRNSLHPSARLPLLNFGRVSGEHHSTPGARAASHQPGSEARPPSPVPPSIPLPPMSIPAHLQLELSTQRPSPLYIHHSHTSDIPFESNAVRIERLINVLVMPFYLERTLYIGSLACLDAWLFNFTILPIRFTVALAVLLRWWLYVIVKEVRWTSSYVWNGLGRLWSRGRHGPEASTSDCVTPRDERDCDRSRSRSRVRQAAQATALQDSPTPTPTSNAINHSIHSVLANGGKAGMKINGDGRIPSSASHHTHAPPLPPWPTVLRHRRTKSVPSNLTPRHKADLLQGAVIIFSSAFLMNLDASRMYHVIRGQDAVKLYVLYNVLEVSNRLLSALGQDIFECLFSTEALSRNKMGRSKVLMPFGLFLLALIYNCIHSVALYYHVVTFNVAVNSYSNALLTLLLSNKFVEVKSTVFKRFEKDNLFQLTCADINERFQLWLMLFIIAMRNVVEVGGLSIPGSILAGDAKASSSKPLHSPSILPHSFTVLPSWLWSGEVLSPFFIVIGIEMFVDTIKHAYINKFNKIRPTFYSRILDILCKDYYSNAFVTPTVTRRVGLAVLPLSCLFIRASIQTYHMFLSTMVPPPIINSTQTALSEESATPSSPAMMAALERLDNLLRDSLGRAIHLSPNGAANGNSRSWLNWTTDDIIAAITMVVVFFIAFLVLLIVKLLLGMVLLRYSRNRYAEMKQKEHMVAAGKEEHESYDAQGRRLGGYGAVEITDDKRRWIHADKEEGLKGRGRPSRTEKPMEGGYQGVQRFEMITKRIW